MFGVLLHLGLASHALSKLFAGKKHSPHFVLKHETTMFSSKRGSRGQLRKYEKRVPGKGLCPLHSRKPFKKGLILNF